jgi:hypothetical protein
MFSQIFGAKIQIVGKSKFKFYVKWQQETGKTISARVLKSFPAIFCDLIIYLFMPYFKLSLD